MPSASSTSPRAPSWPRRSTEVQGRRAEISGWPCDAGPAAGGESQVMQSHTLRDIAVRSVQMMGDGTLEEFREIVHPEFLNHEDKDEPPETRGRGPEPAYKTALWLRDAFAELRWEVHEVVCQGDL